MSESIWLSKIMSKLSWDDIVWIHDSPDIAAKKLACCLWNNGWECCR